MKESLTENDAAHDDEEKSVDILLELAQLCAKRCRSQRSRRRAHDRRCRRRKSATNRARKIGFHLDRLDPREVLSILTRFPKSIYIIRRMLRRATCVTSFRLAHADGHSLLTILSASFRGECRRNFVNY